jgi:hypothetical protein
MGLLDDAIREHLDLKRRRGADPTEVEREEREVLGPVRARVDAARAEAHEDDFEHEPLALNDDPWEEEPHGAALADPEPLPPAAFDHGVIAPLEREPYAAPEPEPEPERYVAPESERYVAPEPERYVTPEPERYVAPEPYSASEREPAPFEPVERQPEREPHPTAAGYEPPDTGEATVEYNVEDALEEEESPQRAGDDEDVLEETPDFLQDTPDHDRLWFEQRPPRDFDFDG